MRASHSLAHWRTKIATNSREWEERNRLLRNEKDIMSRHYQTLKGGMNRFRGAEGACELLKCPAMHRFDC